MTDTGTATGHGPGHRAMKTTAPPIYLPSSLDDPDTVFVPIPTAANYIDAPYIRVRNWIERHGVRVACDVRSHCLLVALNDVVAVSTATRPARELWQQRAQIAAGV